MKRTRLAIIGTLIAMSCSSAIAQESDYDQMCDDLTKKLAAAELRVEPDKGSSNEMVKDIVLLNLQLEEFRLKYAREVQLQAEGIASANVVQTARGAYERIQIQLAGKKHLVRTALKNLELERRIANEMEKSCATSHISGIPHVAASDQTKPSPSLVPGGHPAN